MTEIHMDEPLLSNSKSSSSKKVKKHKVQSKHVKIPNIDNIINGKVVVSTSTISILLRPTSNKENNEQVIINPDTILVVNKKEHTIAGFYECYVPIPGFISSISYKNNLIKLEKHQKVSENSDYLLKKDKNEMNKHVSSLILFFRRNPRLLELIVLIIFGILELFVIIDLILDIRVCKLLYDTNQQIWFTISAILIIAPYFIAWSVLFQFIEKKLYTKNLCYSFCSIIFMISPFGIILLLLYDVYHTFECFLLKPIVFGCSGRKLRRESFEELGYKKLRSVSELFAETICQTLLNAWILYRFRTVEDQDNPINASIYTVLMSFGSAIFSIILWTSILLWEAHQNGLGFIEYFTFVMQGSFNFCPYLLAIERGKPNTESVNWIYYAFTSNIIGSLSMAFSSTKSYCDTIKISTYSIKKLNRNCCKYFGKIMDTNDVQIIVSWRESHIKDFFDIFDTDNSSSFDFIEFTRFMLIIKCYNILYAYHNSIKYNSKQLIYSKTFQSYNLMNQLNINRAIDYFNIFAVRESNKSNKLNNNYVVWKLDILLKIHSSKEWLPVLDIYTPLYYSIQTNNLNLCSLLSSYNYNGINKHRENKYEFKKCVIESIMHRRYKISQILCEEKGIPIVIYIDKISESKQLFQKYNIDVNNNNCNISMYITVNCMNIYEHKTKQININKTDSDSETLVFDDYVLCIIPFKYIPNFGKNKQNTLQFRLSYYFNDDIDDYNQDTDDTEFTDHDDNKEEKDNDNDKIEEKYDANIYKDSIFINHINVNLYQYEQLYKKQGWKQFTSTNSDNVSINSRSFDDDDDDDDNDDINDESQYCLILNEMDDNKLNEIHLSYQIYLGALNVYKKFGLKYIDDIDIHHTMDLDSFKHLETPTKTTKNNNYNYTSTYNNKTNIRNTAHQHHDNINLTNTNPSDNITRYQM